MRYKHVPRGYIPLSCLKVYKFGQYVRSIVTFDARESIVFSLNTNVLDEKFTQRMNEEREPIYALTPHSTGSARETVQPHTMQSLCGTAILHFPRNDDTAHNIECMFVACLAAAVPSPPSFSRQRGVKKYFSCQCAHVHITRHRPCGDKPHQASTNPMGTTFLLPSEQTDGSPTTNGIVELE